MLETVTKRIIGGSVPIVALSAALLASGCQSGGSAVSSYNGGRFQDELSTKSRTINVARHERGESGSRKQRAKKRHVSVPAASRPVDDAAATSPSEERATTAEATSDATSTQKPVAPVAAKGPTILAALAARPNQDAGDALPGVRDPFVQVTSINRLPSARPKKRASKRVINGAGAPIIAKGPMGKVTKRRAKYAHIIRKYAKAHGVPVKLAMAVVQIESMFRPNAVGAAGEIGLMQILPRTARYIGYKGPMKALHDPETNISFGMKYLGKAHKLGGGSTCGTILKYNAGHGAKKMNSVSREYCRRVTRILQNT